MIRPLLLLLALLIPATASAQTHDRAAVLATFERYIQALNAGDSATVSRLQIPEGMTFRQMYDENGRAQLRQRSNREWLEHLAPDGNRYEEVNYNHQVLVERDIAVVWAPYAFFENGRRRHCGVNQFSFVRVEREWKVAGAMWTADSDCGLESR